MLETAGTKVQDGGQTISLLQVQDCRANYLYLTGAVWLGKLSVSGRCSMVGQTICIWQVQYGSVNYLYLAGAVWFGKQSVSGRCSMVR